MPTWKATIIYPPLRGKAITIIAIIINVEVKLKMVNDGQLVTATAKEEMESSA